MQGNIVAVGMTDIDIYPGPGIDDPNVTTQGIKNNPGRWSLASRVPCGLEIDKCIPDTGSHFVRRW